MPLNCSGKWMVVVGGGGGGGTHLKHLEEILFRHLKPNEWLLLLLNCLDNLHQVVEVIARYLSVHTKIMDNQLLSITKYHIIVHHTKPPPEQFLICTVEPRYNEVLGTMKITLLYQVSHFIRVKKQRNIKSWDQQNYLVITGFCYIRPLYNEVPLYHIFWGYWPHSHSTLFRWELEGH